MAALPAGAFTMAERHDTVKVTTFCMDVAEVTARQYAGCVAAGACTTDGLSCHPTATYAASGKEDHPLNCVDSNQAAAYCDWAGKRLPTEEEWEWAARGQRRGTKYPWGNADPKSQLCWKKKDGTCIVGSYPAGDAPGGIHDLAGNVWEWTSSKYGTTTRVNRGGAWLNNEASFMQAGFRYWSAPSDHTFMLGFRCVQ
jgi:formylglycine-generating enzyme required for sulfatase activity